MDDKHFSRLMAEFEIEQQLKSTQRLGSFTGKFVAIGTVISLGIAFGAAMLQVEKPAPETPFVSIQSPPSLH